MDIEHYGELAAFIAIAEACWRKQDPPYSWHLLDWMSYKMRIKYPLIREQDRILSTATIC